MPDDKDLQQTLRMLESALGNPNVPPDMVERVINAHARRRRMRSTVLSITAIAVIAVLTVGGLRIQAPTVRAPVAKSTASAGASSSASSVATSSSARVTTSSAGQAVHHANIVSQVNRDARRSFTTSDVILAGRAGDRTVAIMRRNTIPPASPYHLAAEVWVTNDRARFVLRQDYLAYNGLCASGDAVCVQTRPSGLGLLLLLPDNKRPNAYYVLVALPSNSVATIRTAEKREYILRETGIIHVDTKTAHKLVGIVKRPDHAEYRLIVGPGSMLEPEPK